MSCFQDSLWLPHGSSCPSGDPANFSSSDTEAVVSPSTLLSLLGVIFILVAIVVLVAVIVVLADRIRKLWRKTKEEKQAAASDDVESGDMVISSWRQRRSRRKSRRSSMKRFGVRPGAKKSPKMFPLLARLVESTDLYN